MGRCESCGNDYHSTMTIKSKGVWHTFDCFECAIQRLAPVCNHCETRIIGHGVEVDEVLFCSTHCARSLGKVRVHERHQDVRAF
jgi:hypothetical protein